MSDSQPPEGDDAASDAPETPHSEPENAFFKAWTEFVLRHRLLVVLVTLALTGVSLFMIKQHLRLDMTIESFMDSDSEALRVLEEYRDQFGRDDVFMVLVEGDVFSPDYLKRLRALHKELSGLNLELESLGERLSDRKGMVRFPHIEPIRLPRHFYEEPKEVAGAEPSEDFDASADFSDFEDFDGGGEAASEAEGEAESGADGGGEMADIDLSWGEEKGGTIIDEIISLINVRRTRGREVKGPNGKPQVELDVGELMEPWPSDDELPALKKEVLEDPTLVGQVVSADGRYSVIVLRTQFMNEADSQKVNSAVQEIADRHEQEGFTTYVSGLPSMAASLNGMMQREIQRLLMISLLALALVMFFLFRHPLGVIGPGLVVILAALWTFGLMAALDMPITMLTNILPTFIICVGVGDTVHILSVYRDRRRAGVPNQDAIVHAISSTAVPILFTTLTTAVGLLSFNFATIDAVAEMGNAGAFGVFMALLNTVVILPVLLSLNKKSLLGLNPEKAAKPGYRGDFIDRFLDGCAALSGRRVTAPDNAPVNHRRRRQTLFVAFILGAVALYGGSLINVYHNPLTWMPDDDPAKIAFELVDEHVGGTANIQFLIEKDHGTVKDLELLEGMEKLQAYVQEYIHPELNQPIVGNTISLLDVAKESNRALHGGSQEHYRLPDTQGELSDVLFSFENAGPAQLRRLASADLSKSQMSFRVRWMEATSYGPLTEYVEKGIDKYVGDKANVRATGAAYTLVTTVSSLISNLLRSFGVAFAVITLLMILLLRDIRLGLIAMVPNLLPIVLIAGVMGAASIPIDMANLLIASIAIGLAVDDTIHFLHHFKVHFDVHGDVEAAISYSLKNAGRALVGTSMILSVGFFVFMASEMSSLQRFGGLIGLTVILALLVDLIFSPALLRTFYKSREDRKRKRAERDARAAQTKSTTTTEGVSDEAYGTTG